jgi:hypothetical protein
MHDLPLGKHSLHLVEASLNPNPLRVGSPLEGLYDLKGSQGILTLCAQYSGTEFSLTYSLEHKGVLDLFHPKNHGPFQTGTYGKDNLESLASSLGYHSEGWDTPFQFLEKRLLYGYSCLLSVEVKEGLLNSRRTYKRLLWL